MKCKDCEFEVNKLNCEGICKDCAHRKAQAKYIGKPYVKIKDLKGTKWYDTLVERRRKKGIFLSKEVQENNVEHKNPVVGIFNAANNKLGVKSEKDSQIINSQVNAEKIVDADIEDRIKKLNLHKDLIQFPIDIMLQAFIKIFDNSIISEKTLLKNEYEVFIIDRLHKLLFTEDIDKITEIGLEQRYIESRRCELKKELTLYAPFRELIDELVNDEIFKTKFGLAVEKYEKIKNEYDNYKYMTNTLSMQNLDFTIPGKAEVLDRKLAERHPIKKFNGSVPCNNLYGNKEKTLFETKTPILAENEEQARDILKNMLKQFKGVFYNEKDIIIKEC